MYILTDISCLLIIPISKRGRLKFSGEFVNSSISSFFNYHHRRHILLKDKKTDSQNEKHILSHKVCENGARIPI